MIKYSRRFGWMLGFEMEWPGIGDKSRKEDVEVSAAGRDFWRDRVACYAKGMINNDAVEKKFDWAYILLCQAQKKGRLTPKRVDWLERGVRQLAVSLGNPLPDIAGEGIGNKLWRVLGFIKRYRRMD